jgi:hypothetical protein
MTLQSRLKNSVCLPAVIDKNRVPDYATWASLAVSCRLPTGELDEDRAIDYLAATVIPQVRHRLETKFSKEALATIVQKKLREGELRFAELTVRLANGGNKMCDEALRLVFAEMVSDAPMEQRPGYLQIRAYGQAAVLQPHKGRPGRPQTDNLMRDIQICVCIVLACRGFHVLPTRNEATRYAGGSPSGISLTVAAFRRHGKFLDETHVQKNIWFNLAGELVREVYGCAY